MTAINDDMDATQTTVPVADPTALAPGFYTIDSENIEVLGSERATETGDKWERIGGFHDKAVTEPTAALCIRGVGGSTAATHSDGATLTRYYPDAPPGASEGGGSTPGAVATIDCGVITALDLVTNGETELVPADTGRLIRRVHFGLDGFVDSSGNATGVFIGTPANGRDGSGSFLGQWTNAGVFIDTEGSVFPTGAWTGPDGSNSTTSNVLTAGPLTVVAGSDAGYLVNPTPAWQTLHAYANAALVLADSRLFQVQDAGGTSGASEPDWDASPITDGDFEWTELGPVYGAAHVYADIVTPEAL